MKRSVTFRLSTLTLVFVTVAVVSAVCACLLIFTSLYRTSLHRDAQIRSEQAARQTATVLNRRLSVMEDELSRLCSLARESRNTAAFEASVFSLVQAQDALCRVTVYDTAGTVLSCTAGSQTLKTSPGRDLSFDAALFESAEPFAVSRPHVMTAFEGSYPWVITAVVKIDPPLFGTGTYLTADYRFSEIAGYLDAVGVGRHGYCYLTDTEGHLLYHPQQQLIFSGLTAEPSDTASLTDGSYQEKHLLRTLHTTDNGRWRIVSVSYLDELTAERQQRLVAGALICVLTCAIIAGVLLFLYSRLVTAPVRSLIRAMQTFETDPEAPAGTEALHGSERVAELQTLSRSFSHMTDRIRRLMTRVRQEETALRKTELRALQAQINPHFLYNTLDSIQWMCEQGRTKDASRMVNALARLFRISISRGHELIPLSEEIKHAENYLLIQSFRYRDQFSYRFDVDPTLLHYLCHKITLQPLIENALYHGLDRMVDEGEIVITVRRAPDESGDILLSVTDNGIGMTEKQCQQVLRKESGSGGIGLKNVNDRIRISFGEHYGLSLQSEPDVGTTVTARIPPLEVEPEEGDRP